MDTEQSISLSLTFVMFHDDYILGCVLLIFFLRETKCQCQVFVGDQENVAEGKISDFLMKYAASSHHPKFSPSPPLTILAQSMQRQAAITVLHKPVALKST